MSLGHGWVITSMPFVGMWVLNHVDDTIYRLTMHKNLVDNFGSCRIVAINRWLSARLHCLSCSALDILQSCSKPSSFMICHGYALCLRQQIIVPYNGLSPGRRQAIIWTNAEILLIRTLGTSFSEILISIQIFSLQKMHLKMSCAKWLSFCLCLNAN